MFSANPVNLFNDSVQWLGEHSENFEGYIPTEKLVAKFNLTWSQVHYILKELEQFNLVELGSPQYSEDYIQIGSPRLTYRGWEHYEELKRSPQNSRLAFMAMKFGDSNNGGENYIVEQAYRNLFQPAIQQTGFELRKVTEKQPTGLIDEHIMTGLYRARFVIADITDHNNGVYWEAGFAEALKKPVVYTCEESCFAKRHFDIRNRHTIIWNPNDWQTSQEQLKAIIRSTFPDDAIMEDP